MRKPFLICALCVLCAAALMLVGWNAPQKAEGPSARRVLLLTPDDTGSFFLQLRQGAETAAAETGDELLVALAAEDQVEAQLRQSVQEGVQGVLLYCPDDLLARRIEGCCESLALPLTLLERQDEGCTSVVSDGSAAGESAARYAAERGATSILVLPGDEGRGKARLQGALAVLDGTRCTVKTQTELLAPGDWVLCLSESETAALLTSGLPAGVHLVGMDPGDGRAQALETGAAEALLLPDPYAMGYSGMELMQSLLSSAAQETLRTVEMRLCTLDNLYAEENVRCAFPLLQ